MQGIARLKTRLQWSGNVTHCSGYHQFCSWVKLGSLNWGPAPLSLSATWSLVSMYVSGVQGFHIPVSFKGPEWQYLCNSHPSWHPMDCINEVIYLSGCIKYVHISTMYSFGFGILLDKRCGAVSKCVSSKTGSLISL